MTISYRRLDKNDRKQYRAVRLESLKNHPNSFGSNYEEQRRLPKLKFEEILEDPETDCFMVGAFDGDELIGICGFLDFFPGNPQKMENTGVIIQMYVLEAYSGRKIGLTLINKTAAEARKLPHIDQIYLEVVEGNMSAIRVYEQAGFVDYGPSDRGDLDAKRMILNLG